MIRRLSFAMSVVAALLAVTPNMGFSNAANVAVGDTGRTYADLVISHEGGFGPDGTPNWGRTNDLGGSALGAFQFIDSTRIGLGYHDREAFANSPQMQMEAFERFTQQNWALIQSNVPIGSTTPGGAPITQAGALFSAHFLGAGAFNTWASCGYSVSCFSDSQMQTMLKANGMSSPAELQALLEGRMAEGAGVEMTFDGNYGGSGLDVPPAVLMFWITPSSRSSVPAGSI